MSTMLRLFQLLLLVSLHCICPHFLKSICLLKLHGCSNIRAWFLLSHFLNHPKCPPCVLSSLLVTVCLPDSTTGLTLHNTVKHTASMLWRTDWRFVDFVSTVCNISPARSYYIMCPTSLFNVYNNINF